MNILCIFLSTGFFPAFNPVPGPVHILGFVGSMTDLVLITLVLMNVSNPSTLTCLYTLAETQSLNEMY